MTLAATDPGMLPVSALVAIRGLQRTAKHRVGLRREGIQSQ